MKVLHPAWLWALLVLPVLYWIFLRAQTRRSAQFARFAQSSVWSRIAPAFDPASRLKKARIWCVALAFVFMALARPQWGTHEEIVTVSGLDVLFVLDLSSSMEVEDVVPNRLKKAKHLIRNVVERLRGDRVGLIAFAASSYVACPLTTDTDYFTETLEVMNPATLSNQGTDIGMALETAAGALHRGAEEAGKPEDAAKMASSRVVVLISDGEDQEEGALRGARALKESGAKFYVFGVGTEKGGPIPIREEDGNLRGYKKDGSTPVVSQFRPDALMQVASAGGGKYWNVTVGEGEVEELLSDMGALNRSDYAERRFVVYEDRFQFPLLIAVVLLLLELSAPVRKRITTGGAAVFLFALLSGLDAQAAPVELYLKNKEGLRYYKEGKLEEAKQKFGEAQALRPDQPEPEFNQGVMQLEQGDPETAVRSFERSARDAAARGDHGLAAKSLYNRGAAFEKKSDTKQAIRSYLNAIDSAKAAQDEVLETEARKKLELLAQNLKQQRQKQEQEKKDQKEKESKKDSDDQKDQKQQQGDQSDSKSGKNPGEGQGQEKKSNDDQKQGQAPQKYQDNAQGRKREFKSQNLSKEDADRVMAELSNRERELQGRLKKQKGRVQSRPKDW